MNKITGDSIGLELDVKRFYIPGVIVHSECPKCGSPKQADLGDDYLPFPVVGVPESIHFYCESEAEGPDKYCDTEWAVEVILDLSVRLK